MSGCHEEISCNTELSTPHPAVLLLLALDGTFGGLRQVQQRTNLACHDAACHRVIPQNYLAIGPVYVAMLLLATNEKTPKMTNTVRWLLLALRKWRAHEPDCGVRRPQQTPDTISEILSDIYVRFFAHTIDNTLNGVRETRTVIVIFIYYLHDFQIFLQS